MATPRGMEELARRGLYYCDHCHKRIPRSSFYRHRNQYYNHVTGEWNEADASNNTCMEVDTVDDELFQITDTRNDLEESETLDQPGETLVDDLNQLSEDAMSDKDVSFFEDTGYEGTELSEPESESEDDEEIWSDGEDDEEPPATPSLPPVVRLLLVFLVSWQILFQVPNAALNALVVFLWHFLRLLSHLSKNEFLTGLISFLPKTYLGLVQLLKLDSEGRFTSYVVCPRCNSIYNYESCYEMKNGKAVSKTCEFVAFPHHPHRSQRQPCGKILLRRVKTKRKGVDLVPRKTYPYQSLRDAISFMVSKPDFLAKCEFWRGRAGKVPDNTFADIYDGKIWKEFESERYNHYLQFPGNLLLSLNVDWFQPFSRTRYSVGAIYLVVLNLPREERYKMENVILVGIIPGPKEPKLTLNSYLAPLVLELGEAYNGWNIPVKHTQFKAVSVRACLGCVTCDVPATRKVSGFLGHTARLGCSKCLKEFPVAAFGQKPNFAGYDRENWAPRSVENHKAICTVLLKASSKTSLRDLEAEHGVRYSCLIQLPHFDPIRFAVVDPMHNLLLGTAKHVLFVWIKKGILLPDDLQLIEERSEQIAFPGDVGRIPTKIGSGFAGFTADQWRIWTTVLSPVVLKGILPNHHLRCWLMFVRACCLLLSRILFKPDITTAERYLLMFCKMFQQLYGDEACTPNMHLHMHLATCLLDYGPVYSFWCFPFERFNGLLGAYHTNKKAIEVQIMKKFLHQQCVKDISFPYGYGEFENLLKRKEDSGSLGESKGMDVSSMMSFATVREFGQLSFQLNSGSKLCSMILPLREKVLASDDFHKLETIYQQLYPRRTISFMSRFYHRCRRITLANEIIGSENERSAVVMAYWPGTGSSLENIDYTRCRVGIIQYFLRHIATFAPSQEHEEHLFCFIRWKQSHPSYDWFGHSATVTSLACEPLSACSYMPVQRIAYRCAYGELSVQFVDKTEKVFVVSPVKLKFCI